jgi:hypothetical protein
MEERDYLDAGRLLHWALQPQARPAQEPEYSRLLDRYEDDLPFHRCVQQFAAGLGLDAIESSPFGLLLMPLEDSIFAMHPNAFRGRPVDADDRLLDGLIQVGIAAAVFPRAEDLDEEPTVARPDITVQQIDNSLRGICARLGEQARKEQDPEATEIERGLIEAWRVYDGRFAEKETHGRRSPRGTLQMIRTALDRMVEQGLFDRARGADDTYRARYEYQRRIQLSTARSIVQRIRELPTPAADEEEAACPA